MQALNVDGCLPCAPPAALAALPKGRLLAQSQSLFARAGLDADFSGRALYAGEAGSRLVLARGRDIPLYLRGGAAELGIVGRDLLLEDGAGLVEVADLGFGRCRLVFAGPAGFEPARGVRVASRYPGLAERYLAARGVAARIVALAGAVEGAVGAGLADAVVDVVETGGTLRAHGLVELDEVAVSTARLVRSADRPLSPQATQVARRVTAAVAVGR